MPVTSEETSIVDRAGARSVTAARGVVTTAFPAASEAGREAFAAGGNVVDAAVAAAWALAVCEPGGSGLGGQTVLLIRLASGRIVVVDGHSRAPAAASEQSVSRLQQRAGHRAGTVPTTPAVLAYIQQRYGALPLGRVMEPAVRLAEEGYPVTRLQSRQLRWCQASLAATPAASRFLRQGRPYPAGALFRQPELASALRRIASSGAEDFYRGAIARAIVRDMQDNDGLISAGDLAGVGPPREHEPISVRCGGREVVTIPPPGGGIELLLGLRLLDRLGGDGWDRDQWYLSLASATYASFTERERDPAHPGNWDRARSDLLLAEERVQRLADRITAGTLAGAGPDREEPGETTHLCTADRHGNVVSLTQSIQSLFGAKVANPRYGFLYNNYLVTCPRRRHRYRLASGCPARSNAAPVIVLAGGRPVLVAGGAGSRRIVSSLLHVVSGVLDRGLGLGEALAAPRIHARLSGKVWLERTADTPELREALAGRFRAVELKPARSYSMGAVQAIDLRQPGALAAAADPRRDGAACGW